MGPEVVAVPPAETRVTVRYWASARAAAGCAEEYVDLASGSTLGDLTAVVAERHGPDLARVVAVCSVLVDEQPVASRDPASVLLRDGASIEFLPPFAGG